MSRIIYILLLCSLMPMGGMAQEETLEERRTRIMRKYLREANELSQVDWLIPDDSDEEVIADSEQYGQPDSKFERHTQTMIPPVRTRRPIARPQEESWMLEEDPLTTDPYADPFALKEKDEEKNRSLSRRERWEESRYQRSGQDADGLSFRDERYESRLNIRRDYRSMLQSPTSQRQTGTVFGSVDGEGVSGSRSTDNMYTPSLQPRRTYGSTPDEGLLLSPTYQKRSGQEGVLKPGQIPFKYRQLAPEVKIQPIQRPTVPMRRTYKESVPYQRFKSRQQEWDPTADDAYVDELKRKVLQN